MAGLRDYPPDEIAARQAANWRAFRRMLRALFWLAMVPGLVALWGAGYGKGLLDGRAGCLPAVHRNEGVE
jgi:hypothetical protein